MQTRECEGLRVDCTTYFKLAGHSVFITTAQLWRRSKRQPYMNNVRGCVPIKTVFTKTGSQPSALDGKLLF